MQALTHPYVLAVLAGGVTALLAWLATLPLRPERSEARAGLRALCGMRWQEYSHVVEDLLRERGYAGNDEERLPGQGGFDLVMMRGRSQYLVVCKNGSAHRVTAAQIRELSSLVEMQGAEGAVLATTGAIEPEARALALNRRVEVLQGDELWRLAKPFTPHELRTEAEDEARRRTGHRIFFTALAALLVAVLVAVFAPTPDPSAEIVPAPARARPATARVAPEAAAEAEPSEEELERRRAQAVLEMRGLPAVQNAVWSTQSTINVTLRDTITTIPDSLLDQLCMPVLQFEELRYTRLQVESPVAQPSGAPTVRWRQCR